jgi:hypothetical protein
MANLECGYAGANKEIIRLRADLERGWRNLDGPWGFDEQDYLLYEGESKFRCRLRLAEKAPRTWESRKTFHERYSAEPLRLGNNAVSLHGMKLEVDVPFAQSWAPTNDSNRRPSVYEIREDVFCIETTDGNVKYRLQLWVVLHGRSKMFVKDERELGDGFSLAGGRPESNRRKF